MLSYYFVNAKKKMIMSRRWENGIHWMEG